MITGCEHLLTEQPPKDSDSAARAQWASRFARLQELFQRMDLAFERVYVEDALAAVEATQSAATAERLRMAEACRSATAPQVRLRISQTQLIANDARGWILCEMRQQIDLLSMKLLNEELGDASPLQDDFIWRKFGMHASEVRLQELREMLQATEPRRRASNARANARPRKRADAEKYETIGEKYERATQPQPGQTFEMFKAMGESMNQRAQAVEEAMQQRQSAVAAARVSACAGSQSNTIGETSTPRTEESAAMGRKYEAHVRAARAWASGDLHVPPPGFPADVMAWLQAHKHDPHYARILANALESNALVREAYEEALSGGRAATPVA